MMFDKTTIIDGAKVGIRAVKKGDENRTDDIALALQLCLDDFSNRLKSEGFLTEDTQSVAVNDRSVALTGSYSDLKYLFVLKYENTFLDYVGQEEFLRQYDDSDVTAGTPAYFTVLSADDGVPTIKLDKPIAVAGTLTFYYFPEITEGNISQLRSASALVNGTISYFYNGTEVGNAMYGRFVVGVAQMRAADKFLARPSRRIMPSTFDRGVRDIQGDLRARRA